MSNIRNRIILRNRSLVSATPILDRIVNRHFERTSLLVHMFLRGLHHMLSLQNLPFINVGYEFDHLDDQVWCEKILVWEESQTNTLPYLTLVHHVRLEDDDEIMLQGSRSHAAVLRRIEAVRAQGELSYAPLSPLVGKMLDDLLNMHYSYGRVTMDKRDNINLALRFHSYCRTSKLHILVRNSENLNAQAHANWNNMLEMGYSWPVEMKTPNMCH